MIYCYVKKASEIFTKTKILKSILEINHMLCYVKQGIEKPPRAIFGQKRT